MARLDIIGGTNKVRVGIKLFQKLQLLTYEMIVNGHSPDMIRSRGQCFRSREVLTRTYDIQHSWQVTHEPQPVHHLYFSL